MNIALAVAWGVYKFRVMNVGLCFHRFDLGRSHYYTGSLTCRKCGRTLYPERLKTRRLYRLLGRIHTENES